MLPRRLQGVSGGSPGRDGLPVVAAERDQEKLQTGEDRDRKDTEYVCEREREIGDGLIY